MQKHICGLITALRILYNKFSRLNLQVQKVERDPAFKTQTLLKTVKTYERSPTAEEKVVQNNLSDDALYI